MEFLAPAYERAVFGIRAVPFTGAMDESDLWRMECPDSK
jgi:hypothetical protein